MSINEDHFRQLLDKYANRQASPEELEELFALIKDSGNDKTLLRLLVNALEDTNPITSDENLWDKQFDQLLDEAKRRETDEEKPGRHIGWRRLAIAASILLMVSAGGYFILHRQSAQQSIDLVKQDIAPFSEKAILKTGHGKRIILDSTKTGLLAQNGNTHINKTAGEQIDYSYDKGSSATDQAIFDTLQVPAGGKPYHLKLADGSAIIVNVASMLRYPENFRSSASEVELVAGEAYFSIVHNVKAPLIVKAKGQTIEDLGTEFNVNTYDDEPDRRTTLIEGAVKVNKRALVPGQQAIMIGNTLTIAKADVEQTTAWKNGYFRFNGEQIQTVMRELARWYNIEVKYEGKISKEGYYVKISRSKNISEVLKVLERTNSVHFKIEGRRVTVLSKK